MTFYEVDPPAVDQSGRTVAGLTTGAFGLAQQYLSSIDEARDQMHHIRVKAALDRYREIWHRPVYEVALEIDSLGSNTSASAVTIAETDQDSFAVLATHATATDQQTSNLSRPINGPMA